MKRSLLLIVFMAFYLAPPFLFAGGQLQTADLTGAQAIPGSPNLLSAKVAGVHWDSRCIPVNFQVNGTRNPIPNPLGGPVVSLEQAEGAIDKAMRSWNEIPTSYIALHRTGRVSNAGSATFDFVNEITFSVATTSPFIISAAPSTTLLEDTQLTSGTDIDEDGDSDVAAGIATCTDADGDGDIEFPEGFYKAGTILDNDITFNGGRFRFTVEDTHADATVLSVDLQAIATLELGHAQGLSNSYINQLSGTDGNAASMYPFTDTGDPRAELQQRSLEQDDIAWSSFIYPEGNAASGPAAVQAGDVPFDAVYGVIEGSVQHGALGVPVAGAHVFAASEETGETVVGTYSGTVQVAYDPATRGVSFPGVDFTVLNGRYRLPVPRGIYRVGIEAVDGSPVSAQAIGHLTTTAGSSLGLQNFQEEFFERGNQESNLEDQPGRGTPIPVRSGAVVRGIDFVTNVVVEFRQFGSQDFIGFFNAPPGRYYAVRFTAQQLLDTAQNGDVLIHTALFRTLVADASEVPLWAEALLTTGTVDPVTGQASLNLVSPLYRVAPFTGQDNDFGQLYFPHAKQLTRDIYRGIESGEIQNVFLVLRVPTSQPFPGVSGAPPLIAIDGDGPFGTSYVSNDGVTFTPSPSLNFMFSLVATVD